MSVQLAAQALPGVQQVVAGGRHEQGQGRLMCFVLLKAGGGGGGGVGRHSLSQRGVVQRQPQAPQMALQHFAVALLVLVLVLVWIRRG